MAQPLPEGPPRGLSDGGPRSGCRRTIRDSRVSAAPEGTDGFLTLNNGVSLITGARDMPPAAVRSWELGSIYYVRLNREARDYMRQVPLGQTQQGRYVVTLLLPVVSPPTRQAALFDPAADDPPVEWLVRRCLYRGVASRPRSDRKNFHRQCRRFPASCGTRRECRSMRRHRQVDRTIRRSRRQFDMGAHLPSGNGEGNRPLRDARCPHPARSGVAFLGTGVEAGRIPDRPYSAPEAR